MYLFVYILMPFFDDPR